MDKQIFDVKTTIPLITNSISRSPLWSAFLLIALVLACFAFSPTAQAQLPSPPPDGGYPGDNTAEGENALFSLTTGAQNVAIGSDALYHNTSSTQNTAVGWRALFSNEAGAEFNPGLNTAIGNQALYSNRSSFNTAIGFGALYGNTGGLENTATGVGALNGNISGSDNIALGSFAGTNLTTGDDNIDIGNEGVAGEANTIRIGTQGTQTRTFIAGISGTALGSGMAVRVNANGRLGTAPSSARFKQNIKPMDKASEAILALKPVTFHYKKELDPEGIPQFGLVAENVEKVNPDLVARDDKGKIYTVRYDAVNAMLLNEFLKEHRTVQELKSTATTQEAIIAQLKSAIAQQQKDFATTSAQQQKEFESKIAHQQNEIEALTAGLQKVSAQLEVNKPLPQIVVSDQ